MIRERKSGRAESCQKEGAEAEVSAGLRQKNLRYLPGMKASARATRTRAMPKRPSSRRRLIPSFWTMALGAA